MVGRDLMLDAQVKLHMSSLALDVSLEVARGSTVAIVGPNGAGKTTLLRALAGLLPIEQGAIRLDGVTLDDPDAGVFVPPEARHIGFVFQDHLLFPHLDVVDNVAFGLRARRVARGDARRAAKEALERAGLGEFASRRPGELSGGQAQRVALLRALAPDPKLLLLDEPLASLDASTRTETRRGLRASLGAQGDRACILVTHDPVDAALLADHLIVVESGKVVQTGTAADITAQPRSKYVADLVGVNLLRGTGDGESVSVGGVRVAVPDAPAGDVLAVVHPRAVVIHRREPEGSARNVWRGRVTSVDDEGDRVRVRIDGPIPLVAEITRQGAAALELAAGVEVWAAVKATEISVYDA